jgi:hypothetical protein
MLLFSDAVEADSATWDPIEGNPIADPYFLNVRTNCNYFACSFVAKHTRYFGSVLTRDGVLVAMANSCCAHLDQDFPVKRLTQFESFYLNRSSDRVEGDGNGFHEHLLDQLNLGFQGD